MRISSKNRPSEGFTLLELVIVLAVMTILAGVLLPVVKQILDSAKVSKVVALVDTLTNACKRYYKDTKTFATEKGNSSALSAHTLAFYPGDGKVDGWNGPYLDGPVMNSAIPFDGATIYLLPTVTSPNAGTGYHLAGDPGPTSYVPDGGQEIVLANIPLKWARKIDEAFDGKGIAGGGNAWQTGRVNYKDNSTEPTTVSIFVFDPYGGR